MKKTIAQKITEELEKRQKVNPNYSLRAFAIHLGVSVSILSRILNSKVSMTIKLLERMSVPLALTPEEFDYYKTQITAKKMALSSDQLDESSLRQLEADEFRVIQDWYNFAIMELVNLKSFQPNEVWIAKKLSISEEEALMALERLVRLELIVQDKNGKFIKSQNFVSIIQMNLSTVAMRNRQKQVLQKASEAMDFTDISNRDQSAITIALDSSLVPEIKDRIRKMRRSLANYIDKNSKKKDQVYELSISLFPWSK